MTEALRTDVALSCRILGREGQLDSIFGHVSAREESGAGFWMKGSGPGLDEVDADDVILVERGGRVLEGSRPCHNEHPIHGEIYAARLDVGAVVHTHPPHAVALGATGATLRPVGHEGSFFIPPGVPRFTQTTVLITTPELGAAVADVLGQAPAVLLVNHGIVAVGRDVAEATIAAVLLEKACATQLRAGAAEALCWTSDDEALEKRRVMYHDRSIEQIWQYYARRHG